MPEDLPPADPPHATLTLSTGVASYTDEGDGPAIVAVHGLPGGARDFRYLAPQVTESVRLVRLELPGFGATPIATGPDPSPRGRARFVLDMIDALEIERPVLVGHSMGGVVAATCVDLEPSMFSALALIASPGLRAHAMLRRLPFGAITWLLSGRRRRAVFTPLVRRLFAMSGFRGYPDDELVRTFECVASVSIEAHAERIERLELPTLVAYCEDDPIIEPAIAEELADACPAGPRLCFSSGGHNPQKTHAAEIGGALVELAAAETRD